MSIQWRQKSGGWENCVNTVFRKSPDNYPVCLYQWRENFQQWSYTHIYWLLFTSAWQWTTLSRAHLRIIRKSFLKLSIVRRRKLVWFGHAVIPWLGKSGSLRNTWWSTKGWQIEETVGGLLLWNGPEWATRDAENRERWRKIAWCSVVPLRSTGITGSEWDWVTQKDESVIWFTVFGTAIICKRFVPPSVKSWWKIFRRPCDKSRCNEARCHNYFCPKWPFIKCKLI